jgi:hypothetical protein
VEKPPSISMMPIGQRRKLAPAWRSISMEDEKERKKVKDL